MMAGLFSKSKPERDKWESINFDTNGLNRFGINTGLNLLGKDGWEPVFVLNNLIYLKRKVK